jgi:AAA15 family ATPase/GTPase
MLKKVHITNFLSCKDTEIELDNVTALIGRNAAGKTNILKAIQWCAQFAVGSIPLYEYFTQHDVTNTECSIEFSIDNQDYKYEIKIIKKSSGSNPTGMLAQAMNSSVLIENLLCNKCGSWELVAKRNNDRATQCNAVDINLEINPQVPMMASMRSILPEITLNPAINKTFNYLLAIKYYTLEDDKYKSGEYDKLAEFISGSIYNSWLSGDNKTESAVVMKLLHLWHVEKDLLEELETLIGGNGLNLINKIVIDKSSFGQQNEYFYMLRFNVANTFVNYTQLSYGTQRVLTLLLALLYDKNSTLLIEQPEDGIHSGLLYKLLPLCFEYATVYNKQIIITTHSPDVINLLPPESIRFVRMTEDGTKVSALSKEQLPFVHEFMENEGALFDFIDSMGDE